MRLVAFVVAMLSLGTGCAFMRPAAPQPVVAAEADPWTGFNNGYAKAEEKPAPPVARTDDKPATGKTSAALVEDKASDEEVPAKTSKSAKKGKKKKASAGVAAKKPRKRKKPAAAVNVTAS